MISIDAAITKYAPVVRDINGKYSDAQIRNKTYKIEGIDTKIDTHTLAQIRSANSVYKQQQKVQALAGIHEQPTTSNASSFATDPSGMSKDPFSLALQVANLQNELRFMQFKLDQKDAEINQMKSEGLGSIDERTSVEFMKRDYATLQKDHTDLQERYKATIQEVEELEEAGKGINIFRLIMDSAAANKEMVAAVLSTINPKAAAQFQQLAGLEQGQGTAQNQPASQALVLGTTIVNNFNDTERSELIQIINLLYGHKDLLGKSLQLIKVMVQEKMASAQTIGDESQDPAYNQAQTI